MGRKGGEQREREGGDKGEMRKKATGKEERGKE